MLNRTNYQPMLYFLLEHDILYLMILFRLNFPISQIVFFRSFPLVKGPTSDILSRTRFSVFLGISSGVNSRSRSSSSSNLVQFSALTISPSEGFVPTQPPFGILRVSTVASSCCGIDLTGEALTS